MKEFNVTENGKEYKVKINSTGTESWYIDNKLHREDGPALQRADGDKAWYIDNKLHREDGPAVERSNGYKAWCLNGKKLSEKTFNKCNNVLSNVDFLLDKDSNHVHTTTEDQHMVTKKKKINTSVRRSVSEPMKTIGKTPLYKNQFDCADKVFESLQDHNTFVIAPPQSGKTGVACIIRDYFKNHWMGPNIQTVFFSGTMENGLRDQTGTRIDNTHPGDVKYMKDIKNQNLIDPLEGKVLVCHLSDLKKYKKIVSSLNLNKPIFVINDECHNNQSSKGKFDQFLRKIGIYQDQPKKFWENNRFLLNISATIPSVKTHQKEASQTWESGIAQSIYLEVEDGYCGIAYNDYDTITHRCKQHGKTIKDQAKQVAKDFECMDFGQAVIYQNSQKKQDQLMLELEKMGYKFFDVKNTHNWKTCLKDIPKDTIIRMSAGDMRSENTHVTWDELMNYLKDNRHFPDRKVLLTLRNYGSAGHSMPLQKLFSKYIPQTDLNDATEVQRWGRSMGYGYSYIDKNGNNQTQDKIDDTHITYIDMDTVGKYKKELNSPTDVCMSDNGVKPKKVRNKKTVKQHLCLVPKTTEIRKHIQEYISLDILKENYEYTDPTTGKTSLHLRNTSQNNTINFIGQLTKDKIGDGRLDALICIDGANKSYKESWDVFTDEVDNGTNDLCDFGLKSEHLKPDSEVLPIVYCTKEDTNKTNKTFELTKDNAKNIKSNM